MADSIFLEETEDTPKVILDQGNNSFEISGRSLPEDAIAFYEPIIAWIENYAQNPNSYTELMVRLDYFNSSSSKQLVDLMIKLEAINKLADKEIVIVWGYEKSDDLMKIRGKELESIIEIPFKYQEF